MLDLLGFWDGSQVWSDGMAGKRHRGEGTGDQAERVWAGLGFGLDLGLGTLLLTC